MTDAALTRDAERLYEAVARLVRIYQVRDRERICCHDLSLTQWAALEYLVERGPMSLTDLANLLALDKSSASRAVDGLVRQGRLERVEDSADRRAVRLAASDGGRTLYRQVRADLVTGETEALADMPAEVRAAAIQIIDRLGAVARQRAVSANTDPAACCAPRAAA